MTAQPRRVEHEHTDKGVIPVYTTTVVEQPWASYSATDHDVWKQLFARQRQLLQGRACEETLAAQDTLHMSGDAIPKFAELNAILGAATGWQLVGVEGLLPEGTFFDHLANRRFPVTWWIRKPEQIDYISEPDLFHDLFGHVPLLMNPVFADYMQAYGRGGLKAQRIGPEALANLTRLYWFTVEFGLIRGRNGGLRIYGAGIASSEGESVYALESTAPNRIAFNTERIMRSEYQIDSYQRSYFVINDFQQLFDATRPDFAPIYAQLEDQPSIPAGAIVNTDTIIFRGRPSTLTP